MLEIELSRKFSVEELIFVNVRDILNSRETQPGLGG